MEPPIGERAQKNSGFPEIKNSERDSVPLAAVSESGPDNRRREFLIKVGKALGLEEEAPGIPNSLDLMNLDRAMGRHSEAAVLRLASQARGKRQPLIYFLTSAAQGGLEDPRPNGRGGNAPPSSSGAPSKTVLLAPGREHLLEASESHPR